MYLVVLAVAAVVLAFERPPLRWLVLPWQVLLVAVLAVVVPMLAGLWVRARVLAALERRPDRPAIGQQMLARGQHFCTLLLGVLNVGLLVATDWLNWPQRLAGIGGWPVVPSLIALTPFLASALLVWTALYPADRAIRQIALEVFLMRGKPVRPAWSLGAYLAFNLRHQVLFVLVPMLLIVLARDLIEQHEAGLRDWAQRLAGRPHAGIQYVPDLLMGASAGLVALVAPVLLRYIWITRPLPPGPLRDRLVTLAREIGLRFREILVWHSGGLVVNAAVMGVIPPLRYVLITDAMIEQLDEVRIEGVFGHEAGHIRRHHIAFFLLYAFASACLITVVQGRTHGWSTQAQQIAIAGLGLVLTLKWTVVFAWISRNFERQADLFGVDTLVAAGLQCATPCAVHTPELFGRTGGRPVCRTAAHVFGQTLYDVAKLNGIPPESRSWRHGSIASRATLLVRMAEDPQIAAAFERRVRGIKLAIAAAALVLGLWAGQVLHLTDWL